MNIILLSGGSGKRLWPLSNEIRSKQFLKVFKRADDSHESMAQRNYRMICDVDQNASITIATSENQIASIKAQLGDDVDVSIEPCRRDTFPAIALTTAYLHDMKGISEDETVIVCPVDAYVEKDFFQMLQKLDLQASKNEANLCLIGVEPTYPSEKYGYILPTNTDTISFAESFKEKPDALTAEKYISQGALWNAGVFAYKLKYVLDIARDILGTSSYSQIIENYSNLPKISFDYAVVEKEEKIQVMRFDGKWRDLGTWDALTEVMSDEVAGNAIAAMCENTHIINELQVPLLALGVNNIAIAATADGILVINKDRSDNIKDYVSEQRPMCETREWGEYQVLDYNVKDDRENTLTKRLIIKPGHHISYQKHRHRTEMWTIVEGTGLLIIDGVISEVGRGDTACIKPGTKHAIKAVSELHIIEIQLGDELTEEDVERLEWDWNQEELHKRV
jgi:mannose-1-phosphate guanylyltransferase